MNATGLPPEAQHGVKVAALVAMDYSVLFTPMNRVLSSGACSSTTKSPPSTPVSHAIPLEDFVLCEEEAYSADAAGEAFSTTVLASISTTSATQTTYLYDFAPGKEPREDDLIVAAEEVTTTPTGRTHPMTHTLTPSATVHGALEASMMPAPNCGQKALYPDHHGASSATYTSTDTKHAPSPHTPPHLDPPPLPAPPLSACTTLGYKMVADDTGFDVLSTMAHLDFVKRVSAKEKEMKRLMPMVDLHIERRLEALRRHKAELFAQRTTISAKAHTTTTHTCSQSSTHMSSGTPRQSSCTTHKRAVQRHGRTPAGHRPSSTMASPSRGMTELHANQPTAVSKRAPTQASLRAQLAGLEAMTATVDDSLRHRLDRYAKLRAERKAADARRSACCSTARNLEEAFATPPRTPTPGVKSCSGTHPFPFPLPASFSTPTATQHPAPSGVLTTSAPAPTDEDVAHAVFAELRATWDDTDPRDLIRALQGSNCTPSSVTDTITTTTSTCGDIINEDLSSLSVGSLSAHGTCESAHVTCEEPTPVLSRSSTYTSLCGNDMTSTTTDSDACGDNMSIASEQLSCLSHQDMVCDIIVPSNDKPDNKKAKGVKGIKACWNAFASSWGKAARAVKKVAKGASSCLAPSQ